MRSNNIIWRLREEMKHRPILTALMLWGYIGAVLFVILYDFSGHDMSDIPMYILGIPLDKIAHFVIFSSFSFILALYRRSHLDVKWLRHGVVMVLLGVGFAITTELLQLLLTSYRSFDFYDIVADVCGVFFGLIVVRVISAN